MDWNRGRSVGKDANAMHNARAVGNRLIDLAESSNGFTPLQIIKLVYYCHGWMLGLYNNPLISQPVLAWRYGPVVADVYHALKHYGGKRVTGRMDCPPAEFNEHQEGIIDQVYKIYGKYDGKRLSYLTHREGTPWHQIWSKNGQNSVIPNPLIQEFFSEKANGG